MILQTLRECINYLNESNKSSVKKDRFKELYDSESINIELWKMIYDFDVLFHITSKNIEKNLNKYKGTSSINIIELLHKLDDGLTGNNAIREVCHFVHSNTEFKDLIYDIIDKDLHIGLSVATMNEIVPNLFKEFKVALAQSIKGIKLDSSYVCSHKLDGCFTYSAPVLLADGTQMSIGKIVENKLDVEVMSYNTETNTLEPKRVVNWFNNGVKNNWVKITNNGYVTTPRLLHKKQGILVTDNHKFYDGNGFTEIKNLDSVYSVVLSVSHTQKQMLYDLLEDSITKENISTPKVAYDIEVEDNHNYFVAGMLVHNCRLVTVAKNRDNIKFYSRQGKEFDTLGNLKNSIQQMFDKGILFDNTVLDGEICIVDENGKEDFKSIMKEVKRKDHTIQNPMYIVFDRLTVDEFNSGASELGYRDRISYVDTLCNSASLAGIKHIRAVEHFDYTDEEFKLWQQKVAENGWEGLIARKDVKYENKRTQNMLKIKDFYDAEYKVIDVEMDGDATILVNGKAERVKCVKRLVIEHKGNKVGVGSGLTQEQRLDFYLHPEHIIGRIICVKFFEETVDDNGKPSLRFPTIKHIYEGERDV